MDKFEVYWDYDANIWKVKITGMERGIDSEEEFELDSENSGQLIKMFVDWVMYE